MAWVDPRDRMIDTVASGRSFVDIGGLYETVKERTSVAARAGAKSTTMVDIYPEGHELWGRLQQRLSDLGLGPTECVVGDAQTLTGRTWDVVHSSGVWYHLPHPMMYLERLREVADEYVILTSTIIPDRLETSAGVLEMSPGTMLLLPALDERSRAVVDAYWRESHGLEIFMPLSAYQPGDWTQFFPTWFLPTADCLEVMCKCVGFEVEENYVWPPEVFPSQTLLLKP
jgi:hypothetical protein